MIVDLSWVAWVLWCLRACSCRCDLLPFHWHWQQHSDLLGDLKDRFHQAIVHPLPRTYLLVQLLHHVRQVLEVPLSHVHAWTRLEHSTKVGVVGAQMDWDLLKHNQRGCLGHSHDSIYQGGWGQQWLRFGCPRRSWTVSDFHQANWCSSNHLLIGWSSQLSHQMNHLRGIISCDYTSSVTHPTSRSLL